MKIIVSHPGKQHSYKLVKALSELGYDVRFCTSIAVSTDSNRYLKKVFKKRLVELSNSNIKTFVGLEICRFFFRRIIQPIKAQHYFERLFDYFVSKWLQKQDFDIFIGYECSSKRCFKVCDTLSKTAILDLAQIHYKELQLLGQKYECLTYLTKENRIRQKINCIKEAELSSCNYIFSISLLMRDSLVKHNITKSKILNLPIGNKIEPKPDNKEKSIYFELLYVGTIRDQKGIKLLIQSIDQLQNENIKLTLIGQINEEHYWSIINSRNYITHIPYIPNEKLHKYYQQADIFILPSYLDSWGMVTLEAMSNGLPIIVTQNCGSKDAVKHGGGIVINTGNVDELADAINELYSNEEIRLEMANKAQKIALNYSEKQYRENLNQILTTITINTE